MCQLLQSNASLLAPYPLSRLPCGKGRNLLSPQAVAAEVTAVVLGLEGDCDVAREKTLVTALVTPPICSRLASPSRLSSPPKPIPSLVGFGGPESSRICAALSLSAALSGVIATPPPLPHSAVGSTTWSAPKLREGNAIQYWPLWSPIRLTTLRVVRESLVDVLTW